MSDFIKPAPDTSDLGTVETVSTKKAKSPIWSMKSILYLVVIGAVLGGILIYSNLGRHSVKASLLPPAPTMKNVQGSSSVTAIYQDQKNTVDAQNYNSAVTTGGSSFPLPDFNPTNGAQTTTPDLNQQGDNSSTPAPQLNAEDTSTTPVTAAAASANTSENASLSTSPTATTAYATALGQLLGNEISNQTSQTTGAQVFVAAHDLAQPNSADANGTSDGGDGGSNAAAPNSQQANQKKYVPAPGSLIEAQMINGLNSDAPGPALGLITSGPLQGARVIGSFVTDRGGLVLKFTQMTIPLDGGQQTVTIPIQADAISETGNEVPADVNDHFLENAAVTFIAGFGQSFGNLLQQSGSTTVTSGTGLAITQNPSLTLGTELGAAAGGAVGAVGSQFQQTFGSRPPTIKIQPGTQFTLAFLGDGGGTDSTGGADLPPIRPTVGGLSTPNGVNQQATPYPVYGSPASLNGVQ